MGTKATFVVGQKSLNEGGIKLESAINKVASMFSTSKAITHVVLVTNICSHQKYRE